MLTFFVNGFDVPVSGVVCGAANVGSSASSRSYDTAKSTASHDTLYVCPVVVSPTTPASGAAGGPQTVNDERPEPSGRQLLFGPKAMTPQVASW